MAPSRPVLWLSSMLMALTSMACAPVDVPTVDDIESSGSGLSSGNRLVVRAFAAADLAKEERDTGREVLRAKIHGDFDRDGAEDVLTKEENGFTLELAAGGKARVRMPAADMMVTAVEPVALGANDRVSFVVSTLRHDASDSFPYFRNAQVFVENVGGEYRARALDFSAIGRDVTCTKTPLDPESALCMFASYGRDGRTYSTLVEIDGRGNVRDVTKEKGLPWEGGGGTRVSSDKHVNGKYMMGFAWVDLNGDGLPDLVGGGQHSQLVYMLMKKKGGTYEFTPARWFDESDEYMAISSLRRMHYDFPCVYVHMEVESDRDDYLTCFDAKSEAWNRQRLPAKTSSGKEVRRWEIGRNVKMKAVGGAILVGTRAHLRGGDSEDMVLRVVEKDGTPALVPPLMRSEVFDPAFYVAKHDDVRASVGRDLDRAAGHWVERGAAAGKQGSATFWSRRYVETYPDIAKAFGTDFLAIVRHYVNHGIAEGRAGL